MNRPDLTINIGGRLMNFDEPKVMGIVNVTPDSFYAGSRTPGREELKARVVRLLEEGADIIDVGGCSTRPGATEISAEEEYSRVATALEVIREIDETAIVSVDTFRSYVARRCAEDWNVAIINDIGGGTLDPEMWTTVAEVGKAYILTHMRGTPENMQDFCNYDDVTAEVITDLSKKVYELRGLKINDIIIDPGFGFAKNASQCFKLLNELDEFCRMGMPVLAGLSRKSMIWKTLGIEPAESLTGTIALDSIAIDRGADILRVHDVREAKETIKLLKQLN